MAKIGYIRSAADAHSALIAELLEFPEVKATGFWSALRSLHDAPYFTDLLRTERGWANSIKFVPDAFAIDNSRRTVTVFEAVVTHDVSPNKMGRITELAWALDEDYWDVVLIRCDLSGRAGYAPLASWICEAKDRIEADEAKWPQYHFWQRYTLHHCDAMIASHLPHPNKEG